MRKRIPVLRIPPGVIAEMKQYVDKDYPVPEGTADSNVNVFQSMRWNRMTREERLRAIAEVERIVKVVAS